MWWKETHAFAVILLLIGFPFVHLVKEPLVVGDNEQFIKQELDEDGNVGKNTITLDRLENQREIEVPTETSEKVKENLEVLSHSKSVGDEMKTKENLNDEIHSKRRTRRQAQRTNSLLDSVSQECDGITLRWLRPNIPFSKIYHTSNPEFSYYNIYRQTSYFSSVVGLTPIVSGKDHIPLQEIATDKWIDKFPPSGTSLFYAVTVVDHKGKETQTVVPKQITFIGTIEKTGIKPTLIVPNLLKGDVLHHSAAYNNFRNEYMVAFDLDVNKDGRPDQVYAIRVNGLGQIIDRRILNATVGTASTEQGWPSVAFNPSIQQYLIAFQLSTPSLFQGTSIIVGQRVLGHRTDRFKNPYVLLKATGAGNTFLPVVEPRLVYNSATGGFAMAAMMIEPPKTAFAVFLKPDGTVSSNQRLFRGEVFDCNVFMDPKAREVYFVYQIAQWATTVTHGRHSKLKSYPYFIVATKTNATGGLLTLNEPSVVRYLVGFTREKNANIAGYMNQNNAWLTVFWNNKENGKAIINSSNIFGVPGVYLREENVNSCPTQTQVQNPAACYLPNNNGHILLWEEGSRVGGFLVKDDTFLPVLGKQRQPQVVYNQREQRAFVVWKQKSRGNFVLFVRNVHPGSQFSCRVPCKPTQKCAMKDVCAPQNPGSFKPTCAKNNGGCSHTCLNLPNGRKCSCPLSHTLSLSGMKCFRRDAKPDVSLLYSTEGSIWSLSIYYKEKRTSFTRIPIQGQEIISFAYNKKDEYLYWADSKERTINRAFLNGTRKQVLINKQLFVADGMVLDPDGKLLYWTDIILKAIFRCSLDGTNRVSFVSWLDKPRALALHKPNKWLFWTDWGAVPKIERINTDGSNRKVLFSNGLGWPNGLAIDGSSLYWADAKLDKIEMSDLDGQNRLVVTQKGVAHPFGLDIAGNRLYWSDWAGEIRSFDKSMQFSLPDVIASGIKKPYELEVYDGTIVTKASFCTDPGVPTNGGRNPAPISGDKYKVGDRVILTCNPGFVHLGSNDRRCLPTGKWSGTDTQCRALPVFTVLPKNKTVDVGFSVTLECSASSKSGSNPKITWYKNGKTIPPSSNGRYFQLRVTNYFFIVNTAVDDTGTYTCAASNDAGEVRASMFLRVRSQVVADCGKAKFAPRAKIIGGHRATPGSIPWQVLLWNKRTKKPFCGGSLLNARWGVTAAHCLKYFQLSDIEVRLGEYDWKVSKKTEQYLSIDQLHIHTQYRETTYDSDIALFRFKTKAIMTDYVKPICLPETQSDFALLKANNVGRISGWGARKNNNKSRPVKKLHEVLVPLVNQTICQESHRAYVVTDNMFCAGRTDGKGDACQGDSGGPLTIENKKTGRSVLIGIVSWGDKCGVKDKYGVYTKVPNFVNWIHNHIKHV